MWILGDLNSCTHAYIDSVPPRESFLQPDLPQPVMESNLPPGLTSRSPRSRAEAGSVWVRGDSRKAVTRTHSSPVVSAVPHRTKGQRELGSVSGYWKAVLSASIT